jgi:nucleotide-binding universal stress UspA family protein
MAIMELNTVLCPIDYSALSPRELQLAEEVCRAFDARLVLQHNLGSSAPGFSKTWEWEEVHRAAEETHDEAERHMEEVLAGIAADVRAQASISSGPMVTTLLDLAETLPADLVVLGCHGRSTEDHASLTERILERCPCPVLTIQEEAGGSSFRLGRGPGGAPVPVAVATDLSEGSRCAVSYAFELARALPLRLHLLHVVPSSAGGVEEALHKLDGMVPPDVAERVESHVERGQAPEAILDFAQRVKPVFMVMGEHARGFLRRLLTRDTAREVLHRASVPVWFVPPAAAARQA